jgi:hypothetical protein
MGEDLSLEVEKAQLESHHLIESVRVAGSRGNPKLVVTPTDAHARWQLRDESWDDYDAYIEIQE